MGCEWLIVFINNVRFGHFSSKVLLWSVLSLRLSFSPKKEEKEDEKGDNYEPSHCETNDKTGRPVSFMSSNIA
jgi:hypothetical protein